MSGSVTLHGFEPAPAVLDMMAAALKTKKFKSFELNNDSFLDASDGIIFSIQFAQDYPNLESFTYMHNPIESMEDANNLLGCIHLHPSLSKVCLENLYGAGANGYNILCSLLSTNGNFKSINLSSNSIRAMGGTHIPDFRSSNPLIQSL